MDDPSTKLPSSYVCDTLPAPKLASASSSRSCSLAPPPSITLFESPIVDNASLATELKANESHEELVPPHPTQLQPPARKLCARHQRMADEGTNLKLQQVSSVVRSSFPRSSIMPFWPSQRQKCPCHCSIGGVFDTSVTLCEDRISNRGLMCPLAHRPGFTHMDESADSGYHSPTHHTYI